MQFPSNEAPETPLPMPRDGAADAGDDAFWMEQALAQARQALAAGEVPVGAVLVRDGVLVASGHNRPLGRHDPSAHAEIEVLRAAGLALGNYRLDACTLYVTLEPCAMCAGAMLHARLARVVYGAADPKTGAAGSVVDLFAEPRLNHRTVVHGGVGAAQSAALLQSFFAGRRDERRQQSWPLREDALRTPESRFAELPGYPWQPHWCADLPALDGLRLHYLDEGPRDAARTWLCLHGNPAWSYLYRKMIPVFLAAGDRVVAPDLPGFGKSDKPKRDERHGFLWHRQVLLELVERLDLRGVALVVQDWGGLLGLTLPPAAPWRYDALLAMNTLLATGDTALSPGFLAWREMCARQPAYDVARLFARGNPHLSAAECAAYMAPFPDAGHRAALRRFPAMVPERPDDEGAELARAARSFWRTQWHGASLLAVGLQDPVLGLAVMEQLQQTVRGAPALLQLPHAGHFVQEHGAALAEAALQAFGPAGLAHNRAA